MNWIRRFFQPRTLMLAALVLASFHSTAQTAGSPRPGTIARPADPPGRLAAPPAGEYRFQVGSPGAFPLWMVRSVSGPGAGPVDPDLQSPPDEAPPARAVLATSDGPTFGKSFCRVEAGLAFHSSLAKRKPVRLADAAGPQPRAGDGRPAQ